MQKTLFALALVGTTFLTACSTPAPVAPAAKPPVLQIEQIDRANSQSKRFHRPHRKRSQYRRHILGHALHIACSAQIAASHQCHALTRRRHACLLFAQH